MPSVTTPQGSDPQIYDGSVLQTGVFGLCMAVAFATVVRG